MAALAAHAARLVGAEGGAVVGSRDEARGAGAPAPGSWLAVVEEMAGEDVPSRPAVLRVDARAVATAPVLGSGGRGLLAVAKPPGEEFAPDELAAIEEVAELVSMALDRDDGTAPAEAAPMPESETTERRLVGDFHHRLPAAFERLEGLPALTESRNTLLAVLGERDPSADKIVAAIESDIALLVAVLRLANQAAGAKRATIWSVPEAVEALTPDGVEELARHITVFDFFQRIRGWTIPPEHFRLHAVTTQRAAQRLARLVEHPDTDRLVVAALLHDIGKLVLMEAFPAYPEQVLERAETPEQRLRAERQQLGLDHAMAGGVLLRRWRLPERLAEIVGRHHTADDDRDAGLIRLADALAHYAQGRPVSPRELVSAATAVGVTPDQLRAVMYELPQPTGARRFRAVEPSPLSKRETQLLRELARGLSYQQIGLAAGVSASTVRTHLHNAYTKLNVADRAQAVLKATERGWI